MIKRRCLHCGQDSVVPIVYGLPGHQLMAFAARGEVVLGGCEIKQDQPTHACKACGLEWVKEPGSASLSTPG